jgi:hypothetical protein
MRSDLKSGIFFLIISLVIIWESIRVELGTFLSPGSGFLSFGIGLVLCGLSIVLILRGLKIRIYQKPISIRVILALISLFIYSLVLEYLGFVVPTFFLVLFLFQLGQRRNWFLTIGISLVVTFLAYFIFGSLLHVYFPKGILGI